jgi:hypothetical protein
LLPLLCLIEQDLDPLTLTPFKIDPVDQAEATACVILGAICKLISPWTPGDNRRGT